MRKYLIFSLLSGIMLFTSCALRKITYVDNMVPHKDYSVTKQGEIKIQQNDRLNIIVGSKNPELAAPFNYFTGSYRVDENANISTSPAASSVKENEYIVDNSGNINFPILGTIHVEGQTINGVSELLKDILVSTKLVNDPLVKVNLLNFKITMLGEIGTVGVLSVPDNKITLLDAIARSGGLTQNAVQKKISVIREENGVRKMIVNDISSVALFNSPAYYLQQNDIVYVPPKSGQSDPREDRFWKYFSTATTTLSLLLTYLLWSK